MKITKTAMALACAWAALPGAVCAAAAARGAVTAGRSVPAANSQGEIGDSIISPDLGLAVPISSLDLSRIGAGRQSPGDPGLVVGARYLRQVSSRWSFGGEINHADLADRTFVEPGLQGTIGGSVLTMEGLARYWLTPPQSVNPYVIGGLGINHFAAHVFETSEPPNVLLDGDSTGLLVSAGGGIEGRLGGAKSFVAGTELRWLLSTIDSGAFGSSTMNAMGWTGWLGYRF